jgi:hypothetical protein
MSEKVHKLGIKRDTDMMYYIKNGDVWASPRKKPGQTAKGKAQKVADAGIEAEQGYLYFLDGDGDVARAKRQVGGSKRAKKAGKTAAKKPAAKKAAKKTSAKKGGGKKGGKKGKKK